MYPKNTWYVACTPDEIADKPLGRQICGEKIVFIAAKSTKLRLSRISAPIAALRFLWGMSTMAIWSAAITGW